MKNVTAAADKKNNQFTLKYFFINGKPTTKRFGNLRKAVETAHADFKDNNISKIEILSGKEVVCTIN